MTTITKASSSTTRDEGHLIDIGHELTLVIDSVLPESVRVALQSFGPKEIGFQKLVGSKLMPRNRLTSGQNKSRSRTTVNLRVNLKTSF